jgi:ubiquinone/menaquinone biosynthesis C-methylase UbiE
MIVDISKQRLNYNQIAHLYDEPVRDHHLDTNLVSYLDQRSDNSEIIRILDLGCGTGKQLAANYTELSDLQMVGLDLFAGMLQEARKRQKRIPWIQGDSANPPFRTNSFDYITNQFSYQHVQHQEKLIHEIYRLLKPGGRFVMSNIDPWNMTGWLIYQFFPATWELDSQDFLPVEDFVALMKTAGFSNIQVVRRQHQPGTTLGELYAYVSQRFRTSQFMAITDEPYRAGVQRVKQRIELSSSDLPIQSELCFLTISGDKQGQDTVGNSGI